MEEHNLPQDISKDPRVLMVEYSLKLLKDLTVNKKYKLPASKEKTMEAIHKLNSLIKTIKYSYIMPLELVANRMIKEFDLMANQFWEAILKVDKDLKYNELSAVELYFIFNILKGFKERLKLGNEISLDKAVDIIAVRILSVSKLETTENLYRCRVGDGRRIIDIITNLKDIKKDTVVPAAILPPRKFESEISEAMFCSSQDLPGMHGHVGERILNLPESVLKEINHQIMDLMKDI